MECCLPKQSLELVLEIFGKSVGISQFSQLYEEGVERKCRNTEMTSDANVHFCDTTKIQFVGANEERKKITPNPGVEYKIESKMFNCLIFDIRKLPGWGNLAKSWG